MNIVDDAPIGGDVTHTLQAATGTPTYNLVLVVDRFRQHGDGRQRQLVERRRFDPNTVRMDIAKAALAKLIDRFDLLGNVNADRRFRQRCDA